MAQPKKRDKCTPAEEACVKAYHENGGKRRAAALVGYPHIAKWKVKSQDEFASKMFARKHVKKRMDEVRQKVEKKTEISVEYVLRNLVENLDRCMQTVPVLNADGTPKMLEVPGQGKVAAMYQHNPQAANKAIELMMRNKGMFELDNIQRDSVSRALGKLPLEKLEDIGKKLEKIAAGER